MYANPGVSDYQNFFLILKDDSGFTFSCRFHWEDPLGVWWYEESISQHWLTPLSSAVDQIFGSAFPLCDPTAASPSASSMHCFSARNVFSKFTNLVKYAGRNGFLLHHQPFHLDVSASISHPELEDGVIVGVIISLFDLICSVLSILAAFVFKTASRLIVCVTSATAAPSLHSTFPCSMTLVATFEENYLYYVSTFRWVGLSKWKSSPVSILTFHVIWFICFLCCFCKTS